MNEEYQESDKDSRCCGTCRWHRRDCAGDWVCFNDQSENFADWTEYEDSCEDWGRMATMDKEGVKELAHRYDDYIVNQAYSAGWSDGYASAKDDYGKSKGRTTVHRATDEQREANHTPDLSGWCECGKPILGQWSGFINFCPWCGKIIDWSDSDVGKPEENP